MSFFPDKVKSEYECFSRTIDGNDEDRTVPVSFKNGGYDIPKYLGTGFMYSVYCILYYMSI